MAKSRDNRGREDKKKKKPKKDAKTAAAEVNFRQHVAQAPSPPLPPPATES